MACEDYSYQYPCNPFLRNESLAQDAWEYTCAVPAASVDPVVVASGLLTH